MATILPVTFRASPLESDFKGTPQQLMDAFVARLQLETQEQLALFTIGAVEPTSNVGPWLKDGTTWMVWSDSEGAYVPQTIAFYSTLNPKPFRGNLTAAQDIVFAGPGSSTADLVYTEVFDPDSVFASSTFTAPDAGYYHIDAKAGIAATAGTPTDNTVLFYLKKNTVQMPNELVFIELGDFLDGRTLSINTNLELAAGDTITAAVGIEIGGGSGTWTVSQNDTFFSGYKIRNSSF